jgi:hypothetical protein
MYLNWMSSNHDDEPRDQQADLFSPYWAEVGPSFPEGLWTWSIIESPNGDVVAGCDVPSEAAAKEAVEQWVSENYTVTTKV